jgi:hypothetical protein
MPVLVKSFPFICGMTHSRRNYVGDGIFSNVHVFVPRYRAPDGIDETMIQNYGSYSWFVVRFYLGFDRSPITVNLREKAFSINIFLQ